MGREWVVWAVIIGCIALSAVVAPSLGLPDPTHVSPQEQFASPGAAHWGGTDQFGRDVFSRVLWGARTTLPTAGMAALLSLLIGAGLGITAGAAGSWLDWSLMRLVDILLVLPGILTALLFVALFRSNAGALALGVGISLAPGFSRLVRAAVLSVKHEPFIDASRALGAGPWRIVLKHLLPHVFDEILAYVVVLFAWSVLNIAALEFLGVAGSPSTPRWGSMLFEGREYLRTAPWIAAAPALALMLTVLSITRLSDAWRQYFGRRH